MSVIAAVKDRLAPPTPVPSVPTDVKDKIRRGREAMLKDAQIRRLCVKFWQGDHYWYVNTRGALSVLPSALIAVESGKPLHRIRNTYNFVHTIVEGKVSAASQRVPGYEITPSTDDSDDIAAARLAGQFAVYGYDQWRIRRHTTKAITNALVQREGFVMPYFDPNVGPYTQQPDGSYAGQGEIRLLNLARSEVMWEPGVDFDDSRWHAIERAQLIEDVKEIPGYVGGELEADAAASDLPAGKRSSEMVVVTEFLERPCPKYPDGRRCFIAGGRIIVDYRKVDPETDDWWESYPVTGPHGEVSDEPVLHRISYTVDPEGDDRGLVEHMIDLQRTVNDCWNKLLEWKNRALLPKMMAPRGSNVTRQSDTPGEIDYYNVIGGMKPEWERNPQIPQELFQILQMALDQLRAISADIDVQPDPGLAAKTANAAIESNQARWQSFLGDLAEFHSRLMRHCLTLVAQHYDTQRQIDIRGQYGWEPIASFTGQDLRSQVNVRVLPGSIEALSRQTIQQMVQFIQANWPGAITPEGAMAVIFGGNFDGLIRSYELDVAQANDLVKRLRIGPQAMDTFPPRFDSALQTMVPGWMPRKQCNVSIWKQVIGDYMKTPDFLEKDAETQHMFDLVWDGIETIEQERAAAQAAQQQMQAESLGMGNAGKPQVPPPLPDRAGFTPDTNQAPVPAP